MSRALVLGNGEMLVTLDRFGQLRDLYYPHVGLENQAGGGRMHRIGVWVDGRFSWITDKEWEITYDYEIESFLGALEAKNRNLGISLSFRDGVYNEANIFFRRIEVKNESSEGRDIRIFIGHEFTLSGKTGETAYFEPFRHCLIHYKGNHVVLINGEIGGMPPSDWSVGLSGFMGKEGTYKDAEDGVLSKNPIEHGPVDSVIAFSHFLSGGQSQVLHYWIAIGSSLKEVFDLDSRIASKTLEHILESTGNYWRAWVNKYDFSFYKLNPNIIRLFKKSLMLIRAHADNHGAIIASADSEMLQYGKDTYSYMWPRDAARAAITLYKAGDPFVAKRFFEFCERTITEQGFFMHKYLPDGSLGSSWHPWIREGLPQLPIQEDETAIVLYAIGKYYRHTKDLEFIEKIFTTLIERSAEFLLSFRDTKTGLPKGSYDLWEEKYGTSTFTSSAIYGALQSAADLSAVLGKKKHETRYRKGAEEIKKGIMSYLYDEGTGNFHKLVVFSRTGGRNVDSTIDISSPYGVFNFGVLEAGDLRLKKSFDNAKAKLGANIGIGGIARYEGDGYYRAKDNTPGNPWIITTLWVAEYDIAKAQTESDFEKVREVFSWVARYALPSGMLPEQLNPDTGEQISASPLVWSHAEYVNAILKYLDRLEELGICPTCNPVV
ncbi:MAG: glycoside hydrolase family 15 protein [Patescibacteria group bacterium]